MWILPQQRFKEKRSIEVTNIGFDVYGGDRGVDEAVKGAIESFKLIGRDFCLCLYGKKEQIESALSEHSYGSKRIKIVDCREQVETDDKPVIAIRRKPDSSMVRGFVDLKEGRLSAFVSSGNTGAVLAGSLFKVGRIKGIDRPAICTVYPAPDRLSVLIDAGANAECKPRNFTEFAAMGSIYAGTVLGIPGPKVGLINIGAEDTKGTAVHIAANKALRQMSDAGLIDFYGNIEGRDVPAGTVDVMVADGFTGNIVLKLTEGVASVLMSQIKDAIYSSLKSKIGGLLIKDAMAGLKKRLDYTEYGGAPILGVDGLVVKAHGSSNAKAYSNAIKYACMGVEKGIVDKIKEMVSEFSKKDLVEGDRS